MAKKKKKKKGDKTPYVHIDILPEEEQLPDADIAPEAPNQHQGQVAPGIPGQRVNDPRKRGAGFEPYAAEVVSASGKGLSKKKADGKAPVANDDDPDVTPFVIPVFRKSDIPQQGRGMHPMQQRMYGTGQFPPVGGGAPHGNPRQNLAQIQQNLLNHHSVAQQQAAQRPNGAQSAGHQMGQRVNPQAAQPSQQGAHPIGQQPTSVQQQMHQGAAQARQKQGTGQFAPVTNQMAAQQPHQVQQQPQARGQVHPAQQNLSQQVSQPLPMQGAMQAAASAATARAAQSRATAAQGAIQTAAQAHQASQQQAVRQQAAQQMSAAAQQAAAVSQAAAFQQRQTMPVGSQPAVQGRPVQSAASQAAAGAVVQPQAVAATPAPTDDASEEKGSKPLLDPKAAEDSPMFDKPPVPIEEGMRKSTSGHKTRRRVIVIIAILIVLLGGGAAAYMILSEQGVVPRISIETATVQVTPQDSSNGSSANSASNSNGGAGSTATDPGTTPDAPSGGDLSGTVVYQYTANTASGVEYKVEETVTFQSNGDCQSSTMNMTFPDAASAKTFTDNLARDYGTSFKLDSLNGNNAVVTIDNSGLHLTRDEYENALRYSVSDLVVNK